MLYPSQCLVTRRREETVKNEIQKLCGRSGQMEIFLNKLFKFTNLARQAISCLIKPIDTVWNIRSTWIKPMGVLLGQYERLKLSKITDPSSTNLPRMPESQIYNRAPILKNKLIYIFCQYLGTYLVLAR